MPQVNLCSGTGSAIEVSIDTFPMSCDGIAHVTVPQASEVVSNLLANGSKDLSLLDRMPIGLAIHDAQGELVHSNAFFGRLIGHPRLPSRYDPDLRWQGLSADGAELSPQEFPCSRALRGEIVSPGVDLLYFGKDGQGRWVNVSAAPITDPDRDGILGIVLLYLDAHESVQAGVFAARAARRFRQFAENSGTAIWIADAVTGEFTCRNPLHLGLMGEATRDIADIAGWLEQVDAQDRSALRRHHDEVRQGRTAPFEYGMRGAPGQRARRLREMSFPIRDDAGAIVMIGGMTEDITPAVLSSVYIVGSAARRSDVLASLLRNPACRTKTFDCLADLLDVAQFLTAGCVVVDLATTPDADINLARALAECAATLPVVIIGTAATHAATAVAAMRAGAADYLIPPCAEFALEEAVARAAARSPQPAVAAAAVPPAAPADCSRLERLSRREREVLVRLKAGGTNKSIARELGISHRTVELHRSHLMERLNVRNLAELLQVSQSAGL